MTSNNISIIRVDT